MEISLVSKEHPDSQVWENYALRRLSEEDEKKVVAHLAICRQCQQLMAETDALVSDILHAAARYEAEHRTSGSSGPVKDTGPGKRSLAGLVVGARGAIGAAGLAAACLIAVLSFAPTRPLPAAVGVPLRSLRGNMDAASNRAPALHPLDLSIPSSDVPQAAQYDLELVTATGDQIWTGQANSKDGVLSAHVNARLRAGVYWVRLYAPKSELLAEYGLKIE